MGAPQTARTLDLSAIRRELSEAENRFKRFESEGRRYRASELAEFATGYQQLCALYGRLETFLPGTGETREALRLVARGRQIIYANRLNQSRQVGRNFLHRAPAAMRLIWPYVLVAVMAAATGGLFATVLLLVNPEFCWNFISEETAHHLGNGKIWTDELRSTGGIASSGIASNNITVTFTAFALGITFGIGTLAIMFFNGWHIVGLIAITSRYGMSDRLLHFIAAHGFLELSVIFVAGGCGLYIGDALVHPGSLSRKESLRRRARPAVDLVLFGAMCLLPCGYVEGYISPSASLGIGVKLTLGMLLGVMYWGCLLRPTKFTYDPAA